MIFVAGSGELRMLELRVSSIKAELVSFFDEPWLEVFV